MPTFTPVSVRLPGDGLFWTPIADLTVVPATGGAVLCAGTWAGGGLSVFAPADTGSTLIGQVAWSGQVSGLATPALTVFDAGAGPVLMPVGLRDSAAGAVRIGADGRPAGAYTFPAGKAPPADLVAAVAFDGAGGHFLAAAQAGVPGLAIHRLSDGGVTPVATEASAPVALSGLAAARAGSGTVLVGVSATDNAIVSYRVGTDGTPELGQRIDAEAGTGFDTPTVVRTVELGAASFVIVGGAQSSSLSVWRLSADGALVATDHVVDDRSTRFQNVPALTTFTTEDGRAYALAGGHDDGLTLFALLPDGRLLRLETIADSAAVTLARVSALAAVADGRTAEVFAASATEAGLTQLHLDLGPGGVTQTAGVGPMTGGAGDDLLFAGGQTTALDGGGGDDILVATSPLASIRGGAGRDLFVLSPIEGLYAIPDFQPGQDRLDLSAFPLLRNADQLSWEPMVWGVRLRYGATTIDLHSAAGVSLTRADFTEADLLNLTRFSPGTTPAVPMLLQGTRSADQLTGDIGDDLLTGGGGNDTLAGASGHDILRGEAGHDRLEGGDGDDRLYGDEGNDSLFGGGGRDLLDGGAGRDRLDGDAEDDSLTGGAGNDALAGGAGDDWLDAGIGNDSLDGGDGDDHLLGGDGKDQLWGGAGADHLAGGAGNDRLDGGSGDDRLDGGPGADVLTGGPGRDTFYFPNAADSLGKSRDRITDFRSGEDVLDLSALGLDTDGGAAGPPDHADAVHWRPSGANLLVSVDLNHDGRPDFELLLLGATALSAGDLIL